MKERFIIVGALIGLLFIRGFMFDWIDDLKWNNFWSAFFEFNISLKDMGGAFKSAWFAKSVVGMAFGGLIGFFGFYAAVKSNVIS